MNRDFFYRKKLAIGILGATGMVGQRFIQRLAEHPWFGISALAASDKSAGKVYREVVDWKLDTPIPEEIGAMIIQPCEPSLDCELVFSALDSSIAGDIEIAFAEKGYVVISNASSHRTTPLVPMIVAEVNSDHLKLVKQQSYHQKGMIITNSNCIASPLALALRPLQLEFGIQHVQVTTLQSLSGAGFIDTQRKGIVNNIIPWINGEEEKIESETVRVLGELNNETVESAPIAISAQCHRVPIPFGHMIAVSVKLKTKPSLEALKLAWKEFSGNFSPEDFPSAPNPPIHLVTEQDHPQPIDDLNHGKGMAISIGRIQKCPVNDYKFVILSNNTIRGAAGEAILTAEILLKEGYIFW